jgi:hypothetical protein
MPTVKQTAQDIGVIPLSEPSVADRTTIAREQSAMFPTRLAIARWSSGSELLHPHGPASADAPLRGAWYAEAQRNYQAWLERGGFTQHDGVPDTPASSGPGRDGGAHAANAYIE